GSAVNLVVSSGPAPGTMHVGDLDGTGSAAVWWWWTAQATITVHDGNHAPVAGVLVSGTGSAGGASASASCTTNSAGQCTVSSTVWIWVASASFTVNGLSGGGLTYESTANHDPDGSSNGTTVSVNRL
ncbi:MAG TPA: hypothetical protein VGB88_11070, partial [Alphaproteobacteria bacterium]